MYEMKQSKIYKIPLKKYKEFHNLYVKNRNFFKEEFIECLENFITLGGFDDEILEKIGFINHIYKKYYELFDETDDVLLNEIHEENGESFLLVEMENENSFDEFLEDIKKYVKVAKEVKRYINRKKNSKLNKLFGLNKKGYRKVSKNKFYFACGDINSNDYYIVSVYEIDGELYYTSYILEKCKVVINYHDRVDEHFIDIMPIELVKELGWEDKIL